MKKKKLFASFKVRPWTKPCRSSAPLSLWWMFKKNTLRQTKHKPTARHGARKVWTWMTCLTSLNFCLVTTPFSKQHLLSSLNPTSFSTSLNFWWLKIRPREHRVHEELPSARGRHEHELLYVGTRSQWSTAQQVYTIYTTQACPKTTTKNTSVHHTVHQRMKLIRKCWVFPMLSWMNCHTLNSCSSAWNSWLRPCSATFWSTTWWWVTQRHDLFAPSWMVR